MQSQLLDMALELFESATLPRTTVQTPFNWDTNEWRDNYMAVREGDLEALALAGAVSYTHLTLPTILLV